MPRSCERTLRACMRLPLKQLVSGRPEIAVCTTDMRDEIPEQEFASSFLCSSHPQSVHAQSYSGRISCRL